MKGLWGAWLSVRVGGVRLALNNLFVLLLATLAALGLLDAALWIFALVLAHELGHVWMARRCGVRVESIELLPFGGMARVDDMLQIRPGVEIAVALAGPAVNALLAAGGWWAWQAGYLSDAQARAFWHVNAVIGGFNLLPAFPLDGGRIWRAWQARRIGLNAATLAAVRLGRRLGLLMVLSAVALWAVDRPEPSLAVAGFFIFALAGREQRQTLYVVLRYLLAKTREFEEYGCLPATTLVAKRYTPLRVLLHRLTPQQYHFVAILDDDGKLLATATEAELVDLVFQKGLDVEVGALLQDHP